MMMKKYFRRNLWIALFLFFLQSAQSTAWERQKQGEDIYKLLLTIGPGTTVENSLALFGVSSGAQKYTDFGSIGVYNGATKMLPHSLCRLQNL
jgi:hypothetical protein